VRSRKRGGIGDAVSFTDAVVSIRARERELFKGWKVEMESRRCQYCERI
jgi:hypothetical protein